MNQKKRSFQGFVYVLFLMMAIIILFWWYTVQNSKRIEKQNLNYAEDSAQQTARSISKEFENAINRISTYAYFLGEGLSQPTVNVEALKGMTGNSLFDSFIYTDANGTSVTSDGRVLDTSSKEYYLLGMGGQTGMSVEMHSGLFDETVVTFYAPLHFQGEIIGVLEGIYSANSYLNDLLSASYFGEKADVYLCMRDGAKIASSDGEDDSENIFELLEELQIAPRETLEHIEDIFEFGGEGAYICPDGGKTDNICVVNLPDNEYVLVQMFPKSVTQTMINNANRTGSILELILIILFIIYIITLLARTRKEKKRLEEENREMGYVIGGVNTLFARFVMIDFEKGTYHYLSGTLPERDDIGPSGKVEDLCEYLSTFLIEEEDREKFAELFNVKALADMLGENETDVRLEYHVQRHGNAEWEHMNVICLERKNGRARKALFIRQNITDVKERELKIQARISLANRKERQYRIAITSKSIYTFDFNLTRDMIERDIVCTKDDGLISLLERVGMEAPCRASEWFEKWKRFVAEESIEDYCATINLEYLKKCFEEGDAEINVEYWSESLDGEKICVRQSFIMTWDDDTGDIMVMVVAKEITGQVKKQMEQTQALQDALLEAQHANNAKTTFLSNMSHDIRTPMNAIIGFTTIAVSHIDNRDQVKDCLQKVLSSSNHLLSLINDILDMSRIESGKVQIKEQECNISELMHNLVNIIQPQVKAKQLELFIDTYDIANEDVFADSLKLNQMFVNLISNAVKYTPAGGTVNFRIIQKGTYRRGYGEYVFIIQDNGIGMSPEFVDHIFEPFERESSTTKTGIQGTGLGMAITKNIVDMMGGKISVKSEKNKGTTFTVELSLKLQNTEKEAEKIKELVGQRALVVDDDFDTCTSVCRMLQQIGMRAEWTTSGREAAYRAKSAFEDGDSYHTYIIDWQMPETSGIETARRIRSAVGSEAPIIILTAYDWSDIEEDAREAGISAFCAKPLFMSDLKTVLLVANRLIEKDEEEATWLQADFDGKRILLVEDNELNREIAEEILEETGFIVDTAPDGSDAVEMMKKVEEGYYDAILMDVQMPIMDGYEATRTIRAMPRADVRHLPIIAMTANAMDEDKEAALKNGMTAHIAKPIDVDIFISVLGRYLNPGK